MVLYIIDSLSSLHTCIRLNSNYFLLYKILEVVEYFLTNPVQHKNYDTGNPDIKCSVYCSSSTENIHKVSMRESDSCSNVPLFHFFQISCLTNSCNNNSMELNGADCGTSKRCRNQRNFGLISIN